MAALDLAFSLASERGIRRRRRALVGIRPPYGATSPADEQRQATVEEHELQVAESLAGLAEKYPDVDVATTRPRRIRAGRSTRPRGTPTCSSSAPGVGRRQVGGARLGQPARRRARALPGGGGPGRCMNAVTDTSARKNAHLGTQEPAPRRARTRTPAAGGKDGGESLTC